MRRNTGDMSNYKIERRLFVVDRTESDYSQSEACSELDRAAEGRESSGALAPQESGKTSRVAKVT